MRAPADDIAAMAAPDDANPPPTGAGLRRRLIEGLAAIATRPDFRSLLAYGYSSGTDTDRAAGAAWLHPLLPDLPFERVLVCAGAQNSLMALLATYVKPGELVLCEELTFPGFLTLARQFGVRVKGIAMDGEGLLPDALDDACAGDRAKALYCIPTIHNPTTATMSPARRAAVAEVARKHGLMVFEDDAYGFLPTARLPPLVTFIPEAGFYAATLAKCLMPGLRVAYLVAPARSHSLRMAATLQATTTMAPPPMVALATQWIGDGTAYRIVAAIGRENAARQRVAQSQFEPGTIAAHPCGQHAWLRLAAGKNAGAIAALAERFGLPATAAAA